LFADRLADNHMAPNTAAGFTLIGLALVLIDAGWGRWFLGEALAACASVLGLLCLVGYGFNARAMYGVGAHIPMASNTAMAFELLALGILCNRPDRGIMANLTGPNVGGVAARRLLPVAVILPVALGWMRLQGQHAGLYDTEFGAALMVTVTVVLFASAVCWTATALNKTDADRLHAEQQLRLAYDELDHRVAERTAELVEVNRNLAQRNQDLKQRDDQLRQSQKMEAVGTLAGGVAHEFNNLLQAMQAYTRFAMEGLAAEDPRYLDLQQALTASDRAAALTRQLLGFGRRQALELTNIDPNQLITDLVKLVRPLIGASISVDVSLAEQVGTIHADPGHFQQLMMNLCINARDAMPNGGMLLIKTEDLRLSQRYCEVHPDVEPGRYVAITVTDSGTGMPPEVVEHIFEPFFTTKGVGHGTGLGLAMVYGVVQQHNGVIRVYSEVGIGTTFKIYLPTVESDSATQQEDSTNVPQGGIETILVAEDEPLVRDLYVRILGKAGYTLLTARDGQEAWEIFQAHINEIDLLVLDVVMPRQSGRELHRQIQTLKPDIPVIFCSGYDSETAHVRFADASDHPFLQKPFDPDALLAAVRRVLDREGICSVH